MEKNGIPPRRGLCLFDLFTGRTLCFPVNHDYCKGRQFQSFIYNIYICIRNNMNKINLDDGRKLIHLWWWTIYSPTVLKVFTKTTLSGTYCKIPNDNSNGAKCSTFLLRLAENASGNNKNWRYFPNVQCTIPNSEELMAESKKNV